MEANFFRFSVEELYPKIKGLRIQKVYMPAPGVWTFSFGGSLNLIFFYLPGGGGFYVDSDKPSNPQEPPAQAMWLRKRVKNQKIINCLNLWPERKLAFELSLTGEFLVLDICKGAFLEPMEKVPGLVPDWPDAEEISANSEIWRKYPHITPPLRAALSGLSYDNARKLLDDLKKGMAQGFYLYEDEKGRKKPVCFLPHGTAGHQSFESALEAARAYGCPQVQEMITDAPGRRKLVNSEIKRLNKNLDNIEKDKNRLVQMIRDAQLGELIKSQLYILESSLRKEEVTVGDEGSKRTIKLDPRKTILENMERFFKRAAKGRRGLEFVKKREKELRKKIENVSSSLFVDKNSTPEKTGSAYKKQEFPGLKTNARWFRSSDGFIILRARNRQAGHKLLSREASPHDLWFHVQDGPGAHVILKRAHELVDVPERSLKEAANLAALASYKKNDLKAMIYCARVKDVRKVKGLEQGRVHVDNPLKSIMVNVDPEKESILEIIR